jgi:hypothetical protein
MLHPGDRGAPLLWPRHPVRPGWLAQEEVSMTVILDRIRTCVAALAVGVAGCAVPEGEADPGEPKAVALLSSAAGATTLAFAAREYQDELPDIATAARPPRDFPWVAITFPEASALALSSGEGLSVDLTRSDLPITFEQVYQDVCNPASEDEVRCWLFERYTAGDEGLSGTIWSRVADSGAEGRFDVAWEGMTDRFGDPVQWHRHITSAAVRAVATEVPR